MAEEMVMTGAAETAAETVDNAAAAGVVDPQAESAPEGQERQTEAGAESAPVEPEQKPAVQNRRENARQKEHRHNQEAMRASNGILEYARSKGLQPKNADEAIQMLKAQDAGISFEEYRRKQADAAAEDERRFKETDLYRQMEERAAANEADAKAYRIQQEMARDLAAIQAVDPSVQSLKDLGEDYLKLVEAGMDGLNAYYAMKGKEAMKQAATPPATGPVGSRSDPERDFTSEELDQLTDKDLDDPNILQKAIRSLAKLKK